MNDAIIRNGGFFLRKILFSGLKFYNNISPTDIDGFIDFEGKGFVVIEVKYGFGEVPSGQKLAIERLVDKLGTGDTVSIGIIARHEIPGLSDIDVATCCVSDIRFQNQWHKPEQLLADFSSLFIVRQVINWFIKKHVKPLSPWGPWGPT